ncbi:hypothetical protein HGRIS_009236 [Hohenbuehelia grisea]|uniref:DNA replication checkpoint mediator MRC1 domain-containing protein n=1 Tax=Hohenbuehelia grisea TaxID=104357 RepID=A0ABR3J102_9AGAR
MPITRDDSIAADSTCSPSSPDMSSTAATVSKPAIRTYGRARPREVEASILDSSRAESPTISRATQSVYRTGSPGAGEEIPPSPNAAADSDDDDGAIIPPRRSIWDDLKAVDAEFDAEDASSGLTQHVGASFKLQSPADASSSSPKPTDAGSRTAPASPLIPSKNLEETWATMGTSSHRTIAPSPSSSPPVGTTMPRRNKRPNAIRDSDSELDEAGQMSPPQSTPPQPLQSGPTSSFTPPTSEFEEVSRADKALSSASPASSLGREGEDAVPDPAKPSRPSMPPRAVSTVGKLTKTKNKTKKPLTKKEREQMVRDRGRLAAGRTAIIPLTTMRDFSMGALLRTAQTKKGQPLTKQPSIPSSDPIRSFDSSPPGREPDHPIASASSSTAAFSWGQSHRSPSPGSPSPRKRSSVADIDLGALNSDDDDIFAGIIPRPVAPKVDASKRAALNNMKKQLIEQQKRDQPVDLDSDDDILIVDSHAASDDMHVVAQEEAADRRAQKERHERPSLGRKMAKQFGAAHRPSKPREANHQVQLLKKIEEEKQEEVKRKEVDWIKRGGKIKTTVNTENVKAISAIVDQYAEQHLQHAERQNAAMEVEEDGEEEDSDGEWDPDQDLRGSASPEPELEYASGSEGGDEPEVDEDITMVADEDDESMDATQVDDETQLARPGGRRKRALVLDSDSDNENDKENGGLVRTASLRSVNSPLGLIPHRGSMSSMDDRTEDETDKENNTKLMFDRSEDKENKAVQRGLFEARRLDLSNILSPTARTQGTSAGDVDQRTPLGEIRTDDDPFASPVATSPFAARLLKSTPSKALEFSQTPGPSLIQRFDAGKSPAALEFSQFDEGQENDENAVSAFKPSSLEPGFSQLFEAGTIKPGSSDVKGKGKETPAADALDRLRAPVDLGDVSLTLDAGTLRPALKVNENVRRQADEIFEDEQALLIESALQKPARKPQLYVNDHGFLTQTRPEIGSPLLYHTQPFKAPTPRAALSQYASWLASQTPGGSQAQTQPQSDRHPLRTLSFSATPSGDLDDELENGSPRGLQRLRRVRESRKDASPSPSPSPSKRVKVSTESSRNAFDILARGAKQESARERERGAGRFGQSEFVQAEAVESDDEEEAFGFGLVKGAGDDEEADGEDLDRTLETLVDDADMNIETVAADKVLEKFQEHQEADDQALEKLVKDAAEGVLRQKRRKGGVDLDDSDDEDDDMDAERIRAKRRRKEREDIESGPFKTVYNQSFVDDDAEFSHLKNESQETAVDPDDIVVYKEHKENQSGGESSEDEEPQYVTREAIVQAIRDKKDRDEDIPAMNPHDVAWVDSALSDDEDSSMPIVKTVPRYNTAAPRRQGTLIGVMDFDTQESQLESTQEVDTAAELVRERAALEGWAKREMRTGRNGSTNRSVIAVTGLEHARSKKSKGRAAPGKAVSAATRAAPGATGGVGRSGVKPTRSILSAVDRSARFK